MSTPEQERIVVSLDMFVDTKLVHVRTFGTNFANFLGVVSSAVVDGVVNSHFAHELVLRRRTRPEHTNVLHGSTQLRRCVAHATCNHIKGRS